MPEPDGVQLRGGVEQVPAVPHRAGVPVGAGQGVRIGEPPRRQRRLEAVRGPEAPVGRVDRPAAIQVAVRAVAGVADAQAQLAQDDAPVRQRRRPVPVRVAAPAVAGHPVGAGADPLGQLARAVQHRPDAELRVGQVVPAAGLGRVCLNQFHATRVYRD